MLNSLGNRTMLANKRSINEIGIIISTRSNDCPLIVTKDDKLVDKRNINEVPNNKLKLIRLKEDYDILFEFISNVKT